MIKATRVFHQGAWRWLVVIPAVLNGGRRGRRYFTHDKDGKTAEQQAKELAAQYDRRRSQAAVRLLARPQSHQMALLHAADALGARVMEIGEAVRLYLAQDAVNAKPLHSVVSECLAAKAKGDLSRHYMRALTGTLERFLVGRETKAIGQLGPEDVEQFLAGLKTPSSRRTQMIDLRTLWSFAIARGYAKDNVPGSMQIPRHSDLEPGILTVEQVKILLDTARARNPELMRYLALTLFAGVRPEEAMQLTAHCVKGRYVDVQAKVSKTNRRRLVEIGETFLAYWELGGKLPVKPHEARKVREFVRPWPPNALRHSFISYHSALFGEVATNTAAGHSIAVMNRHYKASVTQEDARRFWELRP